jgi:biopolymer transport protein ExbD
MGKIYITIATAAALLALGILFSTYVRIDGKRIDYAKTNRHSHYDNPRMICLQIEKDGTIWLCDRIVKMPKLKRIFKNDVEEFGSDILIALSVDKNAKISKVKPVLDEISRVGGHVVLLVAKSRDGDLLYYFHARIYEDDFTAKNIVKLSVENVGTKNNPSSLNMIEGQIKPNAPDGTTRVICTGDVRYQDLIDALSAIGNSVEFKIERKKAAGVRER